VMSRRCQTLNKMVDALQLNYVGLCQRLASIFTVSCVCFASVFQQLIVVLLKHSYFFHIRN
jgi:hypothetical protein